MPTTSTLGIPEPLDTDPLADIALAVRDAVDDIDAKMTNTAFAFLQAGVAVGAGATVGMGSLAIPALSRDAVLHLFILHTNSAATANTIAVTPNYANARIPNLGVLRYASAATASQQVNMYALPLVAGSDVTALAFTMTVVNAVSAGRIGAWIHQ